MSSPTPDYKEPHFTVFLKPNEIVRPFSFKLKKIKWTDLSLSEKPLYFMGFS